MLAIIYFFGSYWVLTSRDSVSSVARLFSFWREIYKITPHVNGHGISNPPDKKKVEEKLTARSLFCIFITSLNLFLGLYFIWFLNEEHKCQHKCQTIFKRVSLDHQILCYILVMFWQKGSFLISSTLNKWISNAIT